MEVMRRRLHFVVALSVWLPVAAALAAQDKPNVPPAPPALPGSPAPPQIVAELQRTLDAALARFHAMDEAGVLAYVSAQYRADTLTKAGIGQQLRAVFT